VPLFDMAINMIIIILTIP